MFPRLRFGDEEPRGILRSLAIEPGGHAKPAGLPDLPVVIEERLPSRTLISESTDTRGLVFVQHLDALLFGQLFGIVLISGIPDRKQHDLLAVPQLLNAEI